MVLIGGAFWIFGRDGESEAGDGPSGTNQAANTGVSACNSLHIATTNDMAPVINDVVQAENKGDCPKYVVDVSTPSSVISAIRAQDPERPAVWIPDSPVWAKDPSLPASEITQGPVIARSHAVIAVPNSLAAPATTGLKPWKQIVTSVPFAMDRPHDSTATLLAVTTASRTLGADAQAQGALTQTILAMSQTDTSTGALFDQSADPKDKAKAFPASEQGIAEYNRDHPDAKLSALIPSEGVGALSYPFVKVKGAPGATDDLVTKLQQLLTSEAGTTSLRGAGFRVTERDGGPDVPGQPATSPKLLPDPTDQEVTKLLDLWGKASQDSRQLIVMDVSGSMSAQTTSGLTRAQLARDAGRTGIAGLPQTTEMGLWYFSTNLDGNKDYKEQVPIRRLDASTGGVTQAKLMTTALDKMPSALQGDTGLYDSILAGYQHTMKTYNPNRINSLVVVTDGANDDPKGGITLEQLKTELRKMQNPEKPIPIVAIGIGTSTNEAAMKQITDITKGQSNVAQNPNDIKSVFLKAVLARPKPTS